MIRACYENLLTFEYTHMPLYFCSHRYSASVLRWTVPKTDAGADYPEPGTVGEELRKRGRGDHPRQCAGYDLWRFRTQQPDSRSAVQSLGKSDSTGRLYQQGKGRHQPVAPDNGASAYDTE